MLTPPMFWPVIGGSIASLAQAAFAPVVLAFAPSFARAIRLFDILAVTIFLLPAATMPSLFPCTLR